MTVELAHLSDVHVLAAAGAGPRWHEYLNKRWIGQLNLLLHRKHDERLLAAATEDLRARPPDHLVVTGDLSNLAHPGEFARARDYLEATGLPPERVTLIPGNHDAYTRGATRRGLFERAFAAYLGEAPAWPWTRELDDVLLVATNSAVPTPWFTAFGRLDPAQIGAIEEALSASTAATKVVLVHHPPVIGSGALDKPWRRNRDGLALLEACRRGQADLVLCGHTHAPFRVRAPGARPLWVVCAGSTTRPVRAVGQGGTYNRYRIEPGRVTLTTQAFDPARGAFVPQEPVALIGAEDAPSAARAVEVSSAEPAGSGSD